MIGRVRDGWRSLGYTITWERMLGRDRGGQVFAAESSPWCGIVISTGEVPV